MVSIQLGAAVGLSFETNTPVTTSNPAIILSPGWCGKVWQSGHSYAAHSVICPTATPGILWFTAAGGTSGGSQPAFTNVIGVTVVDNTVSWVSAANYFSYFPLPTDTLRGSNWHHFVFTNTGPAPSQQKAYLDGNALVHLSPQGTSASVNGLTQMSMGTGINPFAGTMDEVALYKTVLTPIQVANHYTTGKWFQQEEFGASVGGTPNGRFNKLMAVAGLDPNVMLNVPYPFRTLMYAETNAVTTTSALNYLQTMTETEPGIIFQDPNGMIDAYSHHISI